MANEDSHYPSDLGTQYSAFGGGETFNYSKLGKSPDAGVCHAAFRFTGITVPQGVTVNYAQLSFYVDEKGTGTGSNLKYICNGIDEDNTSAFGSNPWGRDRTTATVTDQSSLPNVGGTLNINVASMVNEIVGRSGWSSGNAMGFLLFDNTSSDDHWIRDSYGYSILAIRVSSEPNFLPTPKSISAPTFPTATNYGIKISKTGVDVMDATDSELLFTTRKKIVKVIAEGETTTTAGVEKLLAHGLGYTPCVMGFIEAGTYRVKLNRDINGSTDPIGSGLQGYIGADDTNISIITSSNATVYYYVFIEEQSV